MSLNIRKNDNVMVIAGKDRGKTGRIIKVLPREHRVVVERINLVKRHLRPRSAQQPGGIVEKEAPIDLSNIMVMCDPCNAPVRLGTKRLGDGEKVRVCRRCGENLEASSR
jgi:large subunit ribosomal protein L24